MTTVTPVAAAEIVVPVDIVPAPESTAAEPQTPTIPEGDFSLSAQPPAAPRQLSAHVHSLSIDDVDFDALEVVSRDAFSTTYRLPDGGMIAQLGESPVNVQRDGDWVPIDAELQRTSEGWQAQDQPLTPELPELSDDEVTVSNGDAELTWRLLDADDVRGVLPIGRDGAHESCGIATPSMGPTWSTT